MTQRYELVITAVGEVRDADGNLISSEPVELKGEVTDEQLGTMMGLSPEEEE